MTSSDPAPDRGLNELRLKLTTTSGKTIYQYVMGMTHIKEEDLCIYDIHCDEDVAKLDERKNTLESTLVLDSSTKFEYNSQVSCRN